jgi:hypothetical protein
MPDIPPGRAPRVAPYVLAICLGFFPLPLLGLFTPVLDPLIGGGLTVAWLYGFLQFPFAVLVAWRYVRRADAAEGSRR